MKPLVALVALLALAGCSAAEPAEPVTETTTTTETVEATPATEFVTHVPDACLDALRYADELQELNDRVLNIAADGFGSVSRGDTDGVSQAATYLEDIQPVVTDAKVDYRMARDDCQDQ